MLCRTITRLKETGSMKLSFTNSLAVLSMFFAGFHFLIAEEVENPAYTNWVKFPVNTSIVMKSVATTRDGMIENQIIKTLIKKDENQLVISSVTIFDIHGNKQKNDPVQTVVRRGFPLLPGVDKTQIGRPQGIKERGNEIVELLGKKYKAEWYVTQSNTDEGLLTSRVWVSMDVPGQVIKSSSQVKKTGKKQEESIIEIKIGSGN